MKIDTNDVVAHLNSFASTVSIGASKKDSQAEESRDGSSPTLTRILVAGVIVAAVVAVSRWASTPLSLADARAGGWRPGGPPLPPRGF